MHTSPLNILGCFSEALRLIFSKGFRRYIFIPLLLNLLIFIALSSFALDYAHSLFTSFETLLPHWLLWIKWLLWPLLVLVLLIGYGYCFNLITTIIAAPFLGFLAEKVEVHLTGLAPSDETLIQLIPRTFKREFTKLFYFLPRSLCILVLIFILLFLPGANFLGTVIGWLWGSWCLALQFYDYAADNHKVSFIQVRTELRQEKLPTFTFGGLILIGSMIPVVNIFITPLAVVAGTIYWTRKSSGPLQKKRSGVPNVNVY